MLFGGLSDLWKIRAGRRAAVTALQPFVARSLARRAARGEPTAPAAPEGLGSAMGLDRLAGLGDVADTSDSVWLDPYLVGFMATLITLFAKRKTGDLKEEALAGVQETAFAALTGLDGSMFGTELVLHARSPGPPFRDGCRAAGRFFALVTGEPEPRGDADTPDWAAGFFHTPAPEGPEDAVLAGADLGPSPFEAWDRCVEARAGA